MMKASEGLFEMMQASEGFRVFIVAYIFSIGNAISYLQYQLQGELKHEFVKPGWT